LPVYTLTELNQNIRETLDNEYPEALWIRAEIFSFQVNTVSGHCYMELVEGNSRAKAMVWKKTYDLLSRKFQIQTGTNLQKGIAVQFLVKVEYHIQYGLSLVVWDVDIEYSLGEKARKRSEVLRRLETENLLNRNAGTEMPLYIQQFAVISSSTAAGYQDFTTHLKENKFGFAFGFQLFSAQMQGNEAAISIASAFENIRTSGITFQAVVLIRGGGSAADLNVFDEYEVAKAIAECPVPVLTGIGHERDESVADRVAHMKFKTPTAVADFLLERMMQADQAVSDWISEISSGIQGQWQRQWLEYQGITRDVLLGFRNGHYCNEKEADLLRQKIGLNLANQMRLLQEEFRKEETRIFELNPIAILKKGFAMAFQKGKRIQQLREIDTDLPFILNMQDGKEEARLSGARIHPGTE
jgi:exodeoxyribonuclease VII large subunit